MFFKLQSILILVVSCSMVAMAILTDSEKQEILSAHNHFRRIVQPRATNMNKLSWDSELAALAQFWSVNCEMMGNENRHDQSQDFDYVGENAVATSNYTVNFTAMVGSWFLERENYDFDTATCGDDDDYEENYGEDDDDEECDGYTQLVWAYTYKVGCGTFRCEEVRGGEEELENALLLVCNYGPGGSYAGEQPYISGSARCSRCPNSRPRCENHLCVSESSALAITHLSLSVLLLTAVAGFSFCLVTIISR